MLAVFPRLAFVLFAALPGDGIAHTCHNGERIACMEVQSTEGVPSTHGMGAHGSPMCTPAGETVFCLAHHDYHRCEVGQAPCCKDGSNPFHHGHGQGETHTAATNMRCTASASPEAPLVLDDAAGQEEHGTIETSNVRTGTYQPCMNDAYKGQFHHDNTQNKGKATVSYSFDPHKRGCYLIEEYHPGGDEMCARYLPNNAQLDVDWCKGQHSTFYIDQGTHGGQWNPVAKLKFYKNHTGKLTMRNAKEEQCRSPPCFFVSDAFRVTRVSDWCLPDAHLSFQLRLGNANTVDDVLTKVLANKAILLEASLVAHFGYHAVQVLDVTSSARRLSDHSQGLVHFAAPVILHGTPTKPGAPGLDATLAKAFSSAGLQLVSASFGDTPVAPNDDSSFPILHVVLIAGGCAVALLAAIACALYVRYSRKAKLTEPNNAAGMVVTITDNEKNQEQKAKDKQDDADCIDSASTGTPSSLNDIESGPVTPTSSDANNDTV